MSSQWNLCLHWANKYYLYANNDSVIILLQQSQLSLWVHTNPPHSFAKWCCTKLVCAWDVWKVAYTATKVWLAIKTSIMSSISSLLNAPSASSVTTALARGSCGSIGGGFGTLWVFGALFILKTSTMLARELATSDTPWPAETWCDLDAWLVEGLALLVHLHLVGGSDGDGELTLMPKLLSSLLLDVLSE